MFGIALIFLSGENLIVGGYYGWKSMFFSIRVRCVYVLSDSFIG